MIHRIFAAGLLLVGFSTTVFATDGRNAGSLLLYPEFDNRAGIVSVLTVTNVDNTDDAEDIRVHFHYIGKYDQNGAAIDCLEFDRYETMTPLDTLTLVTNRHNPQHERGYVYLVATALGGDIPVTHNFLTGNLMTVDGLDAFEFSVNPIAYRGLTGDGNPTDLDADGLRDMDGQEYSANPGEILIPRFLGQWNNRVSDLILIALTAGTAFDTTVDFLVYNDNEQEFSTEYTFNCWTRVPLLDISGIFDNGFLADWTDHDDDELWGADHIETGWIWMKGAQANSASTTVYDPAIYAVLIERIAHRGASDLPFEKGTNTSGELLAHSPHGIR